MSALLGFQEAVLCEEVDLSGFTGCVMQNSGLWWEVTAVNGGFMGLKTAVDGEVVTISIDGSFDVSVYEQFKEAYQSNLTESNRFVIDLHNAPYIDSSALGMLLLLREKTQGDKARVVLVGVNEIAQRILEIAQFNRLFDIQTKQ